MEKERKKSTKNGVEWVRVGEMNEGKGKKQKKVSMVLENLLLAGLQ